MKVNRKVITSVAGVIAVGVGTYLLLRRKSARKEVKHIAHDPQAMIRNVMHKSKEAQA